MKERSNSNVLVTPFIDKKQSNQGKEGKTKEDDEKIKSLVRFYRKI